MLCKNCLVTAHSEEDETACLQIYFKLGKVTMLPCFPVLCRLNKRLTLFAHSESRKWLLTKVIQTAL